MVTAHQLGGVLWHYSKLKGMTHDQKMPKPNPDNGGNTGNGNNYGQDGGGMAASKMVGLLLKRNTYYLQINVLKKITKPFLDAKLDCIYGFTNIISVFIFIQLKIRT